MPQDPKERAETITEEIARVVAEVERMTGLRSRWNGSVTVWEASLAANLGVKPFLAKKTWECGYSGGGGSRYYLLMLRKGFRGHQKG